MRRQIQGLSSSSTPGNVPDGLYLVRVKKAHYCWHRIKPFYEVNFFVLQPEELLGGAIVARMFCSTKSLWKFAWFLRDFRYSQELLDRDEIDVRALIGLEGVVQITNQIVGGQPLVNLNAFAPASDWELMTGTRNPEVA